MRTSRIAAPFYRTIIALACVAICAAAASADTLRVPGDFPTIQAGIDAAANGDIVLVAPGRYKEAIDFLGKMITVRSSGGRRITIIDAAGLNATVVRFVTGERFRSKLTGFTVTGGGPVAAGGGIKCVGSWPIIEDCRIAGNTALFMGGGMYIADAFPTLTNCEISNNSSGGGGGGVFSVNATGLITDCEIIRNHAVTGGGLLAIGNSTVINCTIANNTATTAGGGIHIKEGVLNLIDSTITRNSIPDSGQGGGIFALNSTVTLTQSEVTANGVGGFGQGGGIYADGSTLLLEQLNLSDNVTGTNGAGGGIYASNSNLDIRDSDIRGNVSDADGGGITVSLRSALTVSDSVFADNIGHTGGAINSAIDKSATVLIRRCTFTANISYEDGGAIAVKGDLQIFDSQFTGNRAPQDGGAIFVSSLAKVNIEQTSFQGNQTVADGGAIKCAQALRLSLKKCTFEGNSAQGSGGALDCDDTNIVIEDCSFVANIAIGEGGAVFLISGTSGEINDCEFSGNRSESWGGSLSVRDGPIRLSDCFFNDNNAARGGGGVYINSRGLEFRNCSFTQNRAEEDGGAILAAPTNDLVMLGCIFTGNSAGGRGGGLSFLQGIRQTVTNCLFTDNQADEGGAINCNFAVLSIINCTFTLNSATSGGGAALSSFESNVDVTNVILWGDFGTSEIQTRRGAEPIVTYCDIQGGYPGEGNIDADPKFVDPVNGDFRIDDRSLCIDAGDSSSVPSGVSTDLDGNPRFHDDPGTPDTGRGPAPIVDMGAYEFQTTSTFALVVNPNPLQPWQTATFTFFGADKFTDSYLVLSIAGPGSTFVPFLNVTIDLSSPQQMGEMHRSNGSGLAEWTFLIPGGFPQQRDVWFQALQFGEKSNILKTFIAAN